MRSTTARIAGSWARRSAVHIFIPGETAEHGLAEQAGQQMAGVLAPAAFRQRRPGQIGKAKRVVQAAVEIDPEGPIIRFTRGGLAPSRNRALFLPQRFVPKLHQGRY